MLFFQPPFWLLWKINGKLAQFSVNNATECNINMIKPRLNIRQTTVFDSSIDQLRRLCFKGSYPSGTSCDPYDGRSMHICIMVDDELAAAARLIPRPTDYFYDTYEGRADVPDSPDAVYLGRVMVAPNYRSHDILELVMREGMLWTYDNGYTTMYGGARSTRKFMPLISELGFELYGTPLQGIYPDHAESSGPTQLLILSTEGKRSFWAERKERTLKRLEEVGYVISDYGSSTGT